MNFHTDAEDASFSTNLVSSVWTYMHDEGVVYSSLDPALIVRKVWPKNQEYTDLKTVWGSFFRFYGLPLPEDETVIKDCVKEGVRLGEFGLARGTPEEKEYTNFLYEEMPFEIPTRDPRAVEVGEIMSKPLLLIESEKKIEDAVELMFKHKIKKLPVIENGRLVGLVTLTDLIRFPEVTRWLETFPLKRTPKRIKKVIYVYSDSKRHLRRKCPLSLLGGLSISCQERKCMWWSEDECSISKLNKQLSKIVQQ